MTADCTTVRLVVLLSRINTDILTDAYASQEARDSKRPEVRTPDRLNVVELRGLEPLTYGLPDRRSPN